ncbi:OmpH family outer membrane protein [Oceanibium sediminis]|uniref:OmpH family outer membrane protein n=1 Tax=Oceanibium sediminis TaxID=2026339 RepID=UPI000DD406DD|nr:OmpH family outer membrane protein [Oceanibium sediminis]
MARRFARIAVLASLALSPGEPLLAQATGDPPRTTPEAVAPPPASAPAAFLILDQDRLFAGSQMGQAIIALNESEAQALRDEGQSLDRAFEAEEQALTEQRPELDPDTFRALADAFDEKVVATRAAQEEKAAALAARSDQRRREFFRRAGPILLRILDESGAGAVVDLRGVLVAKQDLNITDEAIKRLDAAYPAGETQDQQPEDQPERE